MKKGSISQNQTNYCFSKFHKGHTQEVTADGRHHHETDDMRYLFF
jgi:hypothetical protein